jgi:hypothetical protein
MSTVTVVTTDTTGNVINVSKNNPEYGYVRVENITTQINGEGWLRTVKRSALIKGLIEDLISANFTAGQQIPGKIVVRESLTPFNPENPERNLKIAGETGIVCRVDDQPIYRETFYTTDLTAQDELITHTNSEEIKGVNRANRELKKVVGVTMRKAAMSLQDALDSAL